jgi:hypothetical protein
VTLITGFLGSGKTTLLQRLLADPTLSDTAVLINEFGEIGLDHHLLERRALLPIYRSPAADHAELPREADAIPSRDAQPGAGS